MATTRESWKWTNAVPTSVTVIGLPVHGFTLGKTSSIGNAVGGSAAAGTANVRATTLSRPTTSLIIGLPSVLEGKTPSLIVTDRIRRYKRRQYQAKGPAVS